jgi:hypothetical protein
MKAVFKRIFIIFFLSIYTVTASGFHLVLHYCGNQLAFFDINGYHHAEGCCAEEDVFTLLITEAEDGCCKSESTYIKIKEDQFSYKHVEAKKIAAKAFQLYYLPLSLVNCTYSSPLVLKSPSNNDAGPPGSVLSYYLSYNNLRI